MHDVRGCQFRTLGSIDQVGRIYQGWSTPFEFVTTRGWKGPTSFLPPVPMIHANEDNKLAQASRLPGMRIRVIQVQLCVPFTRALQATRIMRAPHTLEL
jgi:hypothetical protein